MLASKGLALYHKLKEENAQKTVAQNLSEYADVKANLFVDQKKQGNKILENGPSDTVGIVCKDREGNIIVALSTGGIPMKMPGRVGDTPQWGSGGYAEDGCGAAATGYGEDLIKVLMTKSMVDRVNVEGGSSARRTQDQALEQVRVLESKVDGKGGVICLDKNGNPGIAFNTPRMAFSFCIEGDERGVVVANLFVDQKKQGNKILENGPSDTVGIVCKDREGNIIVALSTGGIPMKMPGRVGDTPQWGSGGYAEDGCGAAATGYGEDLIKVLMTKSMVDRVNVEGGSSARRTQDQALEQVRVLESKVDGKGGVICLDKNGNPGIAFNTPRMAFSFCIEGDERGVVVGIEPEDLKKI
ncbi:hypothetical protein BB558_002312 [Smittium angustum]|uniref:beta-aspartyl-peptidase n=1 Tax=Smittium angustum TaxID=133377 RepID=A0A2U1J937_SMIAN|nr:hypothetical protein BB558_002312 [Smittium angustum]